MARTVRHHNRGTVRAVFLPFPLSRRFETQNGVIDNTSQTLHPNSGAGSCRG